MHIAPYDFIDAERLQYGRYPVLDTILYRWTRRVEETLFEQVGVEAYAGASVFEEMRFSTFFATLRRPRPIYFFELAPLDGTSLFAFPAFTPTVIGDITWRVEIFDDNADVDVATGITAVPR